MRRCAMYVAIVWFLLLLSLLLRGGRRWAGKGNIRPYKQVGTRTHGSTGYAQSCSLRDFKYVGDSSSYVGRTATSLNVTYTAARTAWLRDLVHDKAV